MNSSCRLEADSPLRQAFPPGVSYSLISENWSYDWYQQDGRWQWRRTSRDTVVTQGALDVVRTAPQ